MLTTDIYKFFPKGLVHDAAWELSTETNHKHQYIKAKKAELNPVWHAFLNELSQRIGRKVDDYTAMYNREFPFSCAYHLPQCKIQFFYSTLENVHAILFYYKEENKYDISHYAGEKTLELHHKLLNDLAKKYFNSQQVAHSESSKVIIPDVATTRNQIGKVSSFEILFSDYFADF